MVTSGFDYKLFLLKIKQKKVAGQRVGNKKPMSFSNQFIKRSCNHDWQMICTENHRNVSYFIKIGLILIVPESSCKYSIVEKALNRRKPTND